MAKKIKLSDEEKQKLKEGLERHSSKYLFNSKNVRNKSGKGKKKV